MIPTINTEGAVTDVAAIARGLRAADRRGLAQPSGSGNFSSAVRNRLCGAGLVDEWDYSITPLGLAVRNHLTEQGVTAS